MPVETTITTGRKTWLPVLDAGDLEVLQAMAGSIDDDAAIIDVTDAYPPLSRPSLRLFHVTRAVAHMVHREALAPHPPMHWVDPLASAAMAILLEQAGADWEREAAAATDNYLLQVAARLRTLSEAVSGDGLVVVDVATGGLALVADRFPHAGLAG